MEKITVIFSNLNDGRMFEREIPVPLTQDEIRVMREQGGWSSDFSVWQGGSFLGDGTWGNLFWKNQFTIVGKGG